jgi:hypothetical protein
MKAMGMESDQEVAQMVGRDPRYGDLLFPSIQVHFLDDTMDILSRLYDWILNLF